MSDRTLRFAARMIAVGLLGVAWTIATMVLVAVEQAQFVQPQLQWLRWIGYLGLVPVAVMLFYVILTDLHDWRSTRQENKDS